MLCILFTVLEGRGHVRPVVLLSCPDMLNGSEPPAAKRTL